MIAENAHMKERMARKSARGGRALLTGLVRCARCARMMRVFYGMRSGRAHRYQCPGDSAHAGMASCIGIGGVRVDQAVAAAIVEAVSPHAIEAALKAAQRIACAEADQRTVLNREREDARHQASLAARRYECVDPAKRLVARARSPLEYLPRARRGPRGTAARARRGPRGAPAPGSGQRASWSCIWAKPPPNYATARNCC